jgi:succinate-acetate transporter protein
MEGGKQLELTAGTEPNAREYRSRSVNEGLHPDTMTTRQPTFPSEYGFREGNAGMVAITGFVMATLTESLMAIFKPEERIQPLWMYLLGFGGLLQIYAGSRDFHHGNTLPGCLFFLFGFHWVAKGLMIGELLFISNTGGDEGFNDSVMGCYYISFTLFELLITICMYLSPSGSYLLITILVVVQIKLIIATVESWTQFPELRQAGGCCGAFVCILAMYSFLAESVAEHGVILPTGKFGAGTVTKTAMNTEYLQSKKSV